MALIRIQCPSCGHVGRVSGALPRMLRCLGCGDVEYIHHGAAVIAPRLAATDDAADAPDERASVSQ